MTEGRSLATLEEGLRGGEVGEFGAVAERGRAAGVRHILSSWPCFELLVAVAERLGASGRTPKSRSAAAVLRRSLNLGPEAVVRQGLRLESVDSDAHWALGGGGSL